MTTMPEQGRVAAHVLLDALADWDKSSHADAALLQVALDRLSDLVGAVRVTVEEHPDELEIEVDWSNLAGATFVLLQWFMERLMAATGFDAHTAITGAREYIDGLRPAAPTILEIQPAEL
jgi:hypothetical protein